MTTRTEIFWSSDEIYDIKCNTEFPCDVPGFETKSFYGACHTTKIFHGFTTISLPLGYVRIS